MTDPPYPETPLMERLRLAAGKILRSKPISPPEINWRNVILTTIENRQHRFRDQFPDDTVARILCEAYRYGPLTNPQMISLIEDELAAIEATMEPWYPRRMTDADLGLETGQ